MYDEPAFVVSSIPVDVQPPLYQSLLLFYSRMLGNTEWVFRSFGVICNLLSAFFLYLIGERIYKNMGKMAVFLYLLLPVVIQGSLLPDIDNSLLTMFMLLFTFIYLWTSATLQRQLGFAIFFFILLWTKNTTPYLYLIIIPVMEWFQTKKLWSAGLSLILGLITTGLFYISLYCFSLFSPANYYAGAIGHNNSYFLAGLNQLFRLKTILFVLYNINTFVLWCGPVLIILGFFSIMFIRKESSRQNKGALVFLYLQAVLVSAGYFIIKTTAAGFPKYTFPACAFLSLLVAYVFVINHKKLFEFKIRDSVLFLSGMAGWIFFIRDPLYSGQVLRLELFYMPGFANIVFQQITHYLFLYTMLTILFLIFWLMLKNSLKAVLFFFLLYALMTNFFQAFASYNVRYAYGEKGFSAATRYLQAGHVRYNQILSRYDLQYYLSDRRQLYASGYETVFSIVSPEVLNERLTKDKNIGYLSFPESDINANINREKVLGIIKKQGFSLDRKLEDYLIYKR